MFTSPVSHSECNYRERRHPVLFPVIELFSDRKQNVHERLLCKMPRCFNHNTSRLANLNSCAHNWKECESHFFYYIFHNTMKPGGNTGDLLRSTPTENIQIMRMAFNARCKSFLRSTAFKLIVPPLPCVEFSQK